MLSSALRDLPFRLAAQARSLYAGEGRLLVLVLGEDSSQGLVAAGGRGRIAVEQFAEVAADPGQQSVRTRIRHVLEKLETSPARTVVASAEVRALPVDLTLPARRRKAREQMLKAARKEMAGFLDFPPELALVTALPLAPAPDAGDMDDEDHLDPSAPRVPALAFAVSRRHCALVENVLKTFGKRLAGMLPLESFAFALGQGPDPAVLSLAAARSRKRPGMGLELEEEEEEPRILVSGGAYELHGVRLGARGPERFAAEPLAGGEEREAVLGRLLAQLAEPGETPRLVVGGAAADLAGRVAAGLLPLAYGSPEDMEGISSPADLPPRYMAAVGAAVVFLRGGRPLLLHENVSPLARVKTSPPALFGLAAGILLLAGAGAWGTMQFRINSLAAETGTLRAQKNEMAARAKRQKDLLGRLDNLKKDVAEMQARKRLLEAGLADHTVRLAQLLRGLVADTPPEIMLTRFEKNSESLCILEGQGTSTTIISQYLLLLRNTPLVTETRLIRSATTAAAAPVRGRNAPAAPAALPLAFTIRMELGGGNG